MEIDVSELGNDSVDILHFIEDAAMIQEDMVILNVSDYEEESKDRDVSKKSQKVSGALTVEKQSGKVTYW